MQKGPHAHDDHLPARLHVHGQEPDTVVHLYGGGELLRRVRRRSRAASAFGLPRGVPLCRCCRISYLRRSALADVDLVSPRLERNHQGNDRRPDLRRPHRRNVWMALASVDLSPRRQQRHGASDTKSELGAQRYRTLIGSCKRLRINSAGGAKLLSPPRERWVSLETNVSPGGATQAKSQRPRAKGPKTRSHQPVARNLIKHASEFESGT